MFRKIANLTILERLQKKHITLSYILLSYYHLISCISHKNNDMFKRHVGLFKLKLHKRTPHGSSVGPDPIPPPRCHLQPGEGSGQTEFNGRGETPSGRSLPTGPYSKRCPKSLLASVRFDFVDFLLFFLPTASIFIAIPTHHLQSLQSLHPVWGIQLLLTTALVFIFVRSLVVETHREDLLWSSEGSLTA